MPPTHAVRHPALSWLYRVGDTSSCGSACGCLSPLYEDITFAVCELLKCLRSRRQCVCLRFAPAHGQPSCPTAFMATCERPQTQNIACISKSRCRWRPFEYAPFRYAFTAKPTARHTFHPTPPDTTPQRPDTSHALSLERQEGSYGERERMAIGAPEVDMVMRQSVVPSSMRLLERSREAMNQRAKERAESAV